MSAALRKLRGATPFFLAISFMSFKSMFSQLLLVIANLKNEWKINLVIYFDVK